MTSQSTAGSDFYYWLVVHLTTPTDCAALPHSTAATGRSTHLAIATDWNANHI